MLCDYIGSMELVPGQWVSFETDKLPQEKKELIK
jgi:hypothetical protein